MDKKMEKLKQDYMNVPIPAELDTLVTQSLLPAPRRRRSIKWFLGSAAAAVALFVSGVNISPTFAQSMSELPAVSALVKLVTFTEYRAEGDGYHADVKVPAITNMPDKKLQDMLNEKYIAEDQKLYKEFMAEIDQLKDKGRPNKGIDSGYEIVTDTDQLLTIRRWVVQTAASAYETIQYDTIDKKNQVLLNLPSLFKDESYVSVISENIKEQMREQMKTDTDFKRYWIKGENEDLPASGFDSISKTQSFYINGDGNLVISFNEYDVAPGFMGPVQFVIPTDVIRSQLVSQQYVK
ncbi:DUF3298 domain-containing protein [Paenibacillus sp. FSL H7-0756]|uniref:DUF3298 domain-containing protein n=1 Tax=Paenibacillus sp. FSL H7-0756 TaxID=2954738 RepID=UPI0030F6E2E5